MQIGIYDPYLDTLGGGERYMLTAAECLSKENVASIFWNDPHILQKAEEKFGLNLKNVKSTQNVFRDTSKFKRFFKTLKYDRILYLSDGSMPLLPAKKTFIHFQAPLDPESISSSSKAKLKTAKGVIVNSYYTKKFIDDVFGTNATVVYPPVEVEKFKVKTKKDNSILTVGRYSDLPKGDFKKHSEMIDAFSKWHKKNKSWKLNMVISHLPQDVTKVEKLKEKTNGNSIKIYTKATNEEVIQMYEKAKIYWHSAGLGEDLLKHPDRAEHFGISVVEAMAAGAVPVVYEAGGLKEIVQDKEAGILWKSVSELLNSTQELADNEDLRKKYAANSRKEAKFYNKKRFCEEINTLLK